MANICTAIMKVRGYKGNVDEFINTLKAHYDYREPNPIIPKYHFFRIFDTIVLDYYNTVGMIYCAEIQIECAWSVYVCMMPARHSYYDDRHNECTWATNLIDESRRLNIEVEIFSREEGLCFQEHIHVLAGAVISDECENFARFRSFYGCTTLDEYINFTGENDLGIKSEEEYQQLAKPLEYGDDIELVIPEVYTMPEVPANMVLMVAVKNRKDK